MIRTLVRVAAVGVVLALTLSPTSTAGTETLSPFCVACAYRWAADSVLNVLLFLPLGATVARPGDGLRGVAKAAAAGLALSLTVELAQFAVPGRHTALGDLLTNAAGAGLGGSLAVTARAWLRMSGRPRRGVTAVWGAAVAAVLLTTSWLLGPSLPRSTYWVQHAPALGQFDTFPGRVVEARTGDLSLPSGRLNTKRREQLRSRLLRRPRLSADAVFGEPTQGLAPVVSIFDDRQREILVLGQDSDDLVFRMRRRADALGLERPEHRAPRLLAGVEPGDTVRIGALPSGRDGRGERGPDGAPLCLATGRSVLCGLGFRPGRGWRLLVDPGLDPEATRWADGAWLALLFLPLGFWANPGWEWRGTVVTAAGAILLAPVVGPVLNPGAAEAVGLASGLVVGYSARQLLGRAGVRP